MILLILSITSLIGSNNFYNSFSQFSSNVFTVKSQLLGKNGYSSLIGSNAVFLNPANLNCSNSIVSFSSYTSLETMIDYSQVSTNFTIKGYSLGVGIATKVIDDIFITNSAWSDNNQDNRVNNQTEIDYNKITNSSEREYLFVVGLPFQTTYFDLGISLKQGYYSLSGYNNYSSSFDVGISYTEKDQKRFGFSTIMSNLLLYKKWSNREVEYFNPVMIESIYYKSKLFKLETSFKHTLDSSTLYSFSIGSELYILKNNRLILGYSINNYYNLSRTEFFAVGIEVDYKNNQLLYGVNVLKDFKYEFMIAININYNTLKNIYNVSNPLRYL